MSDSLNALVSLINNKIHVKTNSYILKIIKNTSLVRFEILNRMRKYKRSKEEYGKSHTEDGDGNRGDYRE